MKRKKQKKVDDGRVFLNDRLHPEMVAKLKQTSKVLQEEQAQKELATKEKERQLKREKEKNKTFEQMLNESNLDWKSYK